MSFSDDDDTLSSENESSEEGETDPNAITKNTILEQVTRNTLVRAIWHCKMKTSSNVTGVDRFHSIYNTMTMQELQMERAYMRRMGFMEVVRIIDERIEKIRSEVAAERGVLEKQLIATRLKGLERSQAQRLRTLDEKQERERQDLFMKFAQEESFMTKKHQRAYAGLVEETANRATGGIIQSNSETAYYMSRQNKSASYKTRKPNHEVIRYRKSAQRLREMGRREEALEFEARAAKMDEEAELKWRTQVANSITSSAWGGAKSKLEQLIDNQQTELKRLKQEHEAKLAWIEQKHEMQRTTIKRTLVAERTKVITMCKKQAKRRQEADAQERLKEAKARKQAEGKSDGMKHISKNLLSGIRGGRGDSDSDSDDGNKQEDIASKWVAPKRSGLDHSAPLIGGEEWAPPSQGAGTAMMNTLPAQVAGLGDGGQGQGASAGQGTSITQSSRRQDDSGDDMRGAHRIAGCIEEGDEGVDEEDVQGHEGTHGQATREEEEHNKRRARLREAREREVREREDRVRQARERADREMREGERVAQERREKEMQERGRVAQARREKEMRRREQQAGEAQRRQALADRVPQRPPPKSAQVSSTPSSWFSRTYHASRQEGQANDVRVLQSSTWSGKQTKAGRAAQELPISPPRPPPLSPDLTPSERKALAEAFLPLAWCADCRQTLRTMLRARQTQAYLVRSLEDLGVSGLVQLYSRAFLNQEDSPQVQEAQRSPDALAAEQMLAMVYLPTLVHDKRWRARLLAGSASDTITGQDLPSDPHELWVNSFLSSTASSHLPMILCNVRAGIAHIMHANPAASHLLVANSTRTGDGQGRVGGAHEVVGTRVDWLDPVLRSLPLPPRPDEGAQWFQRRIRVAFGTPGKLAAGQMGGAHDAEEGDCLYSWVPVRDERGIPVYGVLILLPLPSAGADSAGDQQQSQQEDNELSRMRRGTLELVYQVAALTLTLPKSIHPAAYAVPQENPAEEESKHTSSTATLTGDITAGAEQGDRSWSRSVQEYNILLRRLVDLYYAPPSPSLTVGDRFPRSKGHSSTKGEPQPPGALPSEESLSQRFVPFALMRNPVQALNRVLACPEARTALNESMRSLGAGKLLDVIDDDARIAALPEADKDLRAEALREVFARRTVKPLVLPTDVVALAEALRAEAESARRLVSLLYLPVVLAEPIVRHSLLSGLDVPSIVGSPPTSGGVQSWVHLFTSLAGSLLLPAALFDARQAACAPGTGTASPSSRMAMVWLNDQFSEALDGACGAGKGTTLEDVHRMVKFIGDQPDSDVSSQSTWASHRRVALPGGTARRPKEAVYSWVPVVDNEGVLCCGVVFLLSLEPQANAQGQRERRTVEERLYAHVCAVTLLPRTTALLEAPSPSRVADPLNSMEMSVTGFNDVVRILIDLMYPPEFETATRMRGAKRGFEMPECIRLVKSHVLPPPMAREVCEAFLPLVWYSAPEITLQKILKDDASKTLFEGFCSSVRAKPIFEAAQSSKPESAMANRLLCMAYLPRFLCSPDWLNLLLATFRQEDGSMDMENEDTADAWASSFVHTAPLLPVTTVLVEVSPKDELSIMWLQQDAKLSHALRMGTGTTWRESPDTITFLSKILAANVSSNPVLRCLRGKELIHNGLTMYRRELPVPLVQCLSSWVPIMDQGAVRFIAGVISVVDTNQTPISDTVNTHAVMLQLLPKNVRATTRLAKDTDTVARESEQIRASLLSPKLPTFVVVT